MKISHTVENRAKPGGWVRLFRMRGWPDPRQNKAGQDIRNQKSGFHLLVPNSRFMASIRMGSTSGATLLARALVS